MKKCKTGTLSKKNETELRMKEMQNTTKTRTKLISKKVESKFITNFKKKLNILIP